ncbi:MAG TPA: hypothetical protein VL985_16960 [Stellaceae bacterium]|nr:hypothetical protein [Stellaceae bacterium]
MNPIDQLTADDFAGDIGRIVQIDGSGMGLILDRIDRPMFSGWEKTARKPFSLILRGPDAPVLPEGLHSVQIGESPPLALYVIPIFTPAHDHQDYQIVFN